MARTTLVPAAAADHEAQAEAPAETMTTTTTTSTTLTMARVGVIVRVITLAFLILTVSLLASNSTTITAYNATINLHFNDIYAYRYAFSTAVIGLSYTFLHLLTSVQQIRTGKSPINDPKILIYQFLGDKVVLALLATGVGAAFGATVDLKTKMDDLETAFEVYLNFNVFAPIVYKYDQFFQRAYFPAIFLLIAFLTSGVSSVLSSLPLIIN